MGPAVFNPRIIPQLPILFKVVYNHTLAIINISIIMIIKNFSKLGVNEVRRDALLIAEAGYEAIEINRLFQNVCSMEQKKLCIGMHEFNLDIYKKIYIIGLGKGSARATKSILKTIPSNMLSGGVVIDIEKQWLGKIKSYKGTHPLPSNKNIAATNEIVKLLTKATKDDLVITIICGGGSSLICRPCNKITCTDLQAVGDHLLKSGASITEINTIRKHLSEIHGGYLAKYAYPAHVLSLIVSDVPGNKIDMIASGPTVRDTTTIADARALGKKYGLANLDFVETPKDQKYFEHVNNIVLASGETALYAMKTKAVELGYSPKIYSKALTGFAKNVGPQMAQSVTPGQALLACGETQVHVTHPGKGGRNQDVALSAMPFLPENSAIMSCASDGKDNIPVAGGLVDDDYSVWKIEQIDANPTEAVEMNRSYITLKKIQGIFKIRKVTANISDFIVVLRR